MKHLFSTPAFRTAIVAALLIFAGLFAVHYAESRADANAGRVFDAEAHRGGRNARPENTLYAYAFAITEGMTTIECDMQLTRDGHIVLSHEPVLSSDIARDQKGRYVGANKYDLRRMTLDEIRTFDVGVLKPGTAYFRDNASAQKMHDATIPTLEELFELVQASGDDEIQMNIETKSYPDPASGDLYKYNADPEAFVKAFDAIVRQYDMQDRVILQSFDWRTLRLMKEIDPAIRTSALWSDGSRTRDQQTGAYVYLGGLNLDDYDGDSVAAAHAIGADIFSPYYRGLTDAQVVSAHALGMQVVPWTVNQQSEMARLYRMGVDGIISDNPERLRIVLAGCGATLRPKRTFSSPYLLP